MANRIKPLRRTGSTGLPNVASMQEGEIAVNSYDQKIWMRVGSNLVEIANAGGSATWGSVTGTLSNQTDLKNALDAKADESETFSRTKTGPGARSYHDDSDLNDWTGAIFAYANSSVANRPPMGNANILGWGLNNYNVQIGSRSNRIAFRTQNNGTWDQWHEIWHSGSGATTSSTSTYFYLRGDNSDYGLTLVRSGTQAFLDASSLVRLSVGSTQLDLMSSGVRAAAAGASQQLLVERTNNTINSAIEYKGNSGASVYAGMGDTGLFGIGANSDIRYSHASTWAEFGPSGLRTKSSVIVADGTGIVQAGSLRSSSGAADIASVNAGGIRLMPNGWSTSNHTNIAANGNMTVRGTVTATNQTATSDPRLKDDIKKVKARRELIEKLEYFSFKWKKDGVEGRSIMADKVQEIAPEHVHVGEEDGMLSVDKGALALEMVFALLDKLKEEDDGTAS